MRSTDLLMIHGLDGGDLVFEDGLFERAESFETMLYLILVGSNEYDDNSEATEAFQWLGNEDEEEDRQYRGRFHTLLENLPLNSGNIKLLEDAAAFDLTNGLGDMLESVNIVGSITAKNKLNLQINIVLADGSAETVGLEF